MLKHEQTHNTNHVVHDLSMCELSRPPLSSSLSCVLSQVSLPFDLGGLQYKSRAGMHVCVCVFKLQPWQLHKGRQSWNRGHVAIFQGQRGSLCIDQQWVCHKSANLSPISSPGSRCTLSFHFPHLSLSLSLSSCLSSFLSLHVSQLDLHKTGFLNPRQACEGDLLPVLANIWSRAAWINTLLSIWTLASHQTGDDGPGKLAVDTSYQHLAGGLFAASLRTLEIALPPPPPSPTWCHQGPKMPLD